MTARSSTRRPLNVAIVALPHAMIGTLSGMYDVLNCFEIVATFDNSVPKTPPFRVEIVSVDCPTTFLANNLTIDTTRKIQDVKCADIVIIPSLMVENGKWETGRYPELVDWLCAQHKSGAVLCSACSGVLLLAETGLLSGLETTIHWAFARTFRENFPDTRLALEKVLIAAGKRNEFIMSGGSASWHDLVLYLIARHISPTAAQAISKFMLLQWHKEGHAPYSIIEFPTDHGDAVILTAQRWFAENYTQAKPVESVLTQVEIPERTFKRRFKKATGLTPISYIQNLKIQEARRRLERTETPIDEISWQVGYEDPTFFRRLFKRITGLTPGAYRKKFKLPEFAEGF